MIQSPLSPLLSVTGLTLGLRQGRTLVQDVSFSLARGEVIGLVGESGSGKTMAARALLNLLPPAITRTGGTITFDGHDLTTLDPVAMRRIRGARIGMVFQEPMTSLNPALPIRTQLEEGLILHTTLSAPERHQRMVDMLMRVGIANTEYCLNAYPHQFSGGMRQRIMLAAAMLPRPDLLLADEPTTALDAFVQREVLELMLDLTRENGTAVLMISHDLSMVARYTDRVVVMQQGVVVEQGPTQDLLLHPRHPYTRTLLDALPRRPAPRPDKTATPPLVEVRDLVVRYPGRRRLLGRAPDKQVLHDVSLTVHPGETVALVGGSGSGKTTLGRAIAGLTPVTAGSIRFRGAPLPHRPPFRQPRVWLDWRLDCQMVFQDPYSSLDPRMTIGAAVGEALRHDRTLPARNRQTRIDEILTEVGLGAAYAGRYPHELSGGQRQRVAIARALARRPAFIVADEPVSALDMTVQKQILDLFTQLQDHYSFACLFISHDLGVVEQIADRVMVMHDGRIVEHGPCHTVFDSPQHPYTRQLLSAIPMLEPQPGGGLSLRWRYGDPSRDHS